MLRLLGNIPQLLNLLGHELIELLDSANPLLLQVLRIGLLVDVLKVLLQHDSHLFLEVLGHSVVVVYDFAGVVILPLGAHSPEIAEVDPLALVDLLLKVIPGLLLSIEHQLLADELDVSVGYSLDFLSSVVVVYLFKIHEILVKVITVVFLNGVKSFVS